MTIIKKFEPEKQKKGFSKKYVIIIAVCLLALSLVEIWTSHSLITYGEKLDKLSGLAKSLSLENQILENEIAKNASLNSIASESAQLGFLQPERIQYIR